MPVVNALSSRYHPTQILADMLTMLEVEQGSSSQVPSLSSLAGRKVAWVGDSNNILNDMLVAYPRIGIHLSVATPPGAAYERDPVVWKTMEKRLAESPGEHGSVQWTNDPAAAVRDADYIATDTWYVRIAALACLRVQDLDGRRGVQGAAPARLCRFPGD